MECFLAYILTSLKRQNYDIPPELTDFALS